MVFRVVILEREDQSTLFLIIIHSQLSCRIYDLPPMSAHEIRSQIAHNLFRHSLLTVKKFAHATAEIHHSYF
jgi:hypothetical protein